MPIDFKSPYVIGGAALLVVLLLTSRGGSSSSGALGVASQQTATAANVQLAQLSSAYAANRDTIQGQVAIAGMQKESANLGLALGYLTNLDNNATVRYNTDAAVKINSTNTSILPQLQQISANEQVQLAQTQVNGELGLAQIQQGTTLGRGSQQMTGGIINGVTNFASGILGAFGL